MKALLGIEPIVYIKDNSLMTFYIDLRDKDYTVDEITQVSFILSQDNQTCVCYNLYEEQQDDAERGFDSDNERLWLTCRLGGVDNPTSIFKLNCPIKCEIDIELTRLLPCDLTDEVMDSMMVKTETITETLPKIILTEADLTPSLLNLIHKSEE